MEPSKNLSSGDPHSHFMKIALKLARKGAGFVAPNPLVGAVIVRDGKIVGEGYHEKFGGPHAEVNALEEAGQRARGATIYVTLEPCNHHGKTPPCTRAILKAGIKRVVIGMLDPNPDVRGGGAQFLRNHGINVLSGVLEEECRQLNEFFIKHVTEGIPFVIAKVAATLDGKTSTKTGDSKWITSDKSRKYGHRLRHQVAAILVGIGTVLADDPMLTVRIKGKKPSNPARFVFDTFLRISLRSNLVKTARDIPTVVVAGLEASENKERELREMGMGVWRLPSRNGRVDPVSFVKRLGREGFNSLLVEGGAAVHGSFFDARVVDKIFFFFAPKILGGFESLPMVGGRNPEKMSEALHVTEARIRRIGGDFLVTGYIRK